MNELYLTSTPSKIGDTQIICRCNLSEDHYFLDIVYPVYTKKGGGHKADLIAALEKSKRFKLVKAGDYFTCENCSMIACFFTGGFEGEP